MSDEIIQKTQKSLGKYVKKPPLSEKLLKKPPFRFLHDVIVSVVRETGFLKGLFTERELNSENVKEKEAKVAFLSKLIEAVKFLSQKDLAARPSKIVAGLEPAETNVLLQTIAKCIDKKIDSSDYVKKSKNLNTEKNKTTRKAPKDNVELVKKASKISLKDEKITEKKKRSSILETPLSTDRTKSKSTSKEEKLLKSSKDHLSSKKKSESTKESRDKGDGDHNREDPAKLVENTVESATDTIRSIDETSVQNKTVETSGEIIGGTESEKPPEFQERKASARPKSARPKSGDNNKDKLVPSKHNLIVTDDDNNEIEQKLLTSKPKNLVEETPNKAITQQVARPKSSLLRPPSVRPSSARPGAPRLRPDSAIPMQEVVALGKINVIVENFDKDADEEETVVIQNAPDVENEGGVLDVPNENKGQLVEQILEQINEDELEKIRSNVNIEWEKDGLRGKDATTKEIAQLRSSIQSLTRTANPLGKLMNYLHEDIDAMQAELEMWTNTKKQLFLEIIKQKRMSEDANKPLLANLDFLEQEIEKQGQEILSVRSNILKNDTRIKELLTK